MGFFSWLFGTNKNNTPQIPTILPDIAKKEVLCGRLPEINVNTLFLRRGEICHYADRAMWEKVKTKKITHRYSGGHSTPGLLKGNRWYAGSSTSFSEDVQDIQHIKGILYVTNRRIIFSSQNEGFDKEYKDLSAVQPYANCIELQFGKDVFKIFVPDGNVANMVIHMLQ